MGISIVLTSEAHCNPVSVSLSEYMIRKKNNKYSQVYLNADNLRFYMIVEFTVYKVLADSTKVPTYYICKLTSKVVVVHAKAKMQNILSRKSLEKTKQIQLCCFTF